jgi:hypothetical protein
MQDPFIGLSAQLISETYQRDQINRGYDERFLPQERTSGSMDIQAQNYGIRQSAGLLMVR